jgi:hypothetical protein
MADDITTGMDFKDSIVRAIDPANESIQSRNVPQTLQFPLVQKEELAYRIADRELRKAGFPRAEVQIKANRNLFKAKPGDLYNWSYPPYGIEQLILRVIKVEEEGPESEAITVYLQEDVYYMSYAHIRTISVYHPNAPRPAPLAQPLSPLVHVRVVELPYALAGGDIIKLGLLASRVEMNEVGYAVMISFDGVSYAMCTTGTAWCIHGVLSTAFMSDRFTIDDDENGVIVNFSNSDCALINSISRSEMFGLTNLALIGNEYISFQSVEIVETNRLRLTGIMRARFDTYKEDHYPGDEFWFIGGAAKELQDNLNFFLNGVIRIRLVPYNLKSSGVVYESPINTITITRRASRPYPVSNLKLNGVGLDRRSKYYGTVDGVAPDLVFHPDDILLEWSGRIREGEGAGFGNVDTVVDSFPIWEGAFMVKVFVGGVEKRAEMGIDALSWVYTTEMNEEDNGVQSALVTPLEITFWVQNYIAGAASPNEWYFSDAIILTILGEVPVESYGKKYSLSVYPTQSDHDGFAIVGDSVLTDNVQSLRIGWNRRSYIKFPNVALPPGAYITSATLVFRASTDDSGTCLTAIAPIDDANADIPTSVAELFSASLTLGVDWAVPNFSKGVVYASPDFFADIQQIVNKPGWVSGNSIVMVIVDDGSDAHGKRNMYSFDYGDDFGGTKPYIPELKIKYTVFS